MGNWVGVGSTWINSLVGHSKKEKQKEKTKMKNQFLIALAALLKDKNGCHSLREVATALFIVIVIISWIAQQFFGREIPEFMFYSLVGLVGAGCFGYSIEKKQV